MQSGAVHHRKRVSPRALSLSSSLLCCSKPHYPSLVSPLVAFPFVCPLLLLIVLEHISEPPEYDVPPLKRLTLALKMLKTWS
ncbi:hypothetical protein BDN72DRAFT_851164 [Pluteus cervinus]|uniref:Uncharacterized protein n=1 Tax=Pluteus cervinus TaxID=181527 RepID=A0ACD3A1T1_9AGAR|nr:hypothetical protein BDN72DRAFT_851164 [Pluteus cervinus]